MKTISLIIPVYNVEAYLPRCLDSVLQNAYPDLEIICVNDGSTDHSAAVLTQYAEKDARIRVIHQENRGVSAARNAGLEAATGELISFLDGDDWLHPRFFRIMAYWQISCDADIVICERLRVYPGDSVKMERIGDPDGMEYRFLDGRAMMADHTAKAFVWGRVFRKTLLDGLRFPMDIDLGEDRAYNLALVSNHPGMRIVKLSQPMYCYFSREDSAVHAATPEDWLALALRFLCACETEPEKQLFLTEAFKLGFSARYACQKKPELPGGEQADALLAECMRELKKTPRMPVVRKAAYGIITWFPGAYRFLLWMKTNHSKRKERQTR